MRIFLDLGAARVRIDILEDIDEFVPLIGEYDRKCVRNQSMQ